MKRYRVDLSQTVYESCTVYVEADSPEEAEAEAMVLSVDREWRFDEVHGREAIAVTEYEFFAPIAEQEATP